jgi:phosphoenolpyruvate synthase/pyruvate phosphate dikinase
MIVVAHDIAPADMLQFKTQTFKGFVTDLGGRTSHTAIVARSLGIPASVGVQQASALDPAERSDHRGWGSWHCDRRSGADRAGRVFVSAERKGA